MTPIADNETDTYDLVIVGGGMVGASLACALGNSHLKILVIEAVPLDIQTRSTEKSSYDDRAIALSYGSHTIFQSMGVWGHMVEHATAIEHIHVSEQGQFGVSRIDHRQANVPALGFVISARAIGNALKQQLQTLQNQVHFLSPAKLIALHTHENHALITLDTGQEIKTRLLVAADGGQSSVRTLCNIPIKQHDYQQTAIIANISCEHHQANTAYERFTPEGPLALLPMSQQRYSLVWTREHKHIESIMALNDNDFLQQLQAAFGTRLGKLIKTGKREAYPLQLIRTCEQVRPRIALIGNAAHTLHPIAGQGFNLGLRDVATLAQVVVDAQNSKQDIGAMETLNQYAQWRHKDQNHIITLTDTLVRVFSNRLQPLSFVRNIGLIGMDLLPPLKQQFSKHTMGMAGKLPRLARGLPL